MKKLLSILREELEKTSIKLKSKLNDQDIENNKNDSIFLKIFYVLVASILVFLFLILGALIKIMELFFKYMIHIIVIIIVLQICEKTGIIPEVFFQNIFN